MAHRQKQCTCFYLVALCTYMQQGCAFGRVRLCVCVCKKEKKYIYICICIYLVLITWSEIVHIWSCDSTLNKCALSWKVCTKLILYIRMLWSGIYYNENVNVNNTAAAPRSCLRFFYDGITCITNIFKEDASTCIIVRMALVRHCSPSPWTATFVNSKMCTAALDKTMLGNDLWWQCSP